MLVFVSLLLSLSKCIYAQTRQNRFINYVLAPVLVSLKLSLRKYVLLKYRFFYVKSFVIHASINFQFCDFDTSQYAFFIILDKILSWIAVSERYIRKRFSDSSQICGQTKTRQLKFIVIVYVYLCGNFLSSPVLYTNSKYLNNVWTVLCLCILTSSNTSQIYMTEYFGYFSDILHVVNNHFPSVPYHLTR